MFAVHTPGFHQEQRQMQSSHCWVAEEGAAGQAELPQQQARYPSLDYPKTAQQQPKREPHVQAKMGAIALVFCKMWGMEILTKTLFFTSV